MQGASARARYSETPSRVFRGFRLNIPAFFPLPCLLSIRGGARIAITTTAADNDDEAALLRRHYCVPEP